MSIPLSLRPYYLSDVIGNRNVIDCIKISVDASLIEKKSFPHTLLKGASGLGKTTIGLAIANELNVDIQTANGATLTDIKMLLPYLARIEPGSVFLIDEVHALKSKVQECLYTAMEDFYVDFGRVDKPIKMRLPEFTLIGATTESGKLNEPFLNRFKNHYTLEYYSTNEILQIIEKNASKVKLQINKNGLREIAKRSKSTPRLANAYLEWVKDYAVAHSINHVDKRDVEKAFKFRDIDENGLTVEDRMYLNALKGSWGPCGLETIESITRLSRETIVNVIEPALFRMGFAMKTSKGRVLCNNEDFEINHCDLDFSTAPELRF